MSKNFTNGEGGFSEEEIMAKMEADSTVELGAPNGNAEPSIDEIQEMIKMQMDDDEENQSEYFDDFENSENLAQDVHAHTFLKNSGEPLENQYYDISPCEKKYVVSINPDVVPIFDKLTPEKRTELVNKLLYSYLEEQKQTPEKVRIKKLINHSIVVFVILAFGFPAIFFLTNASIEATVNSYRQIQGNFERLYQQKGGVKRKDLTKIQNLQY